MKLGNLNHIGVATPSIAMLFLLAACGGTVEGPVYALACKLEGPAVGKADVRFPANVEARTIFWSTGSSEAKPVAVSEWTDATIKGSFQLADSYDLVIDLASGKAELTSTSLATGKESSSAGPCEKVAATEAERALVDPAAAVEGKVE